MGDGNAVGNSFLVEEIDHTPIRECRDRQPGHPLQGLLVIERGGQRPPGLVQQPQGVFGLGPRCDVNRAADHSQDPAEIITQDTALVPDGDPAAVTVSEPVLPGVAVTLSYVGHRFADHALAILGMDLLVPPCLDGGNFIGTVAKESKQAGTALHLPRCPVPVIDERLHGIRGKGKSLVGVSDGGFRPAARGDVGKETKRADDPACVVAHGARAGEDKHLFAIDAPKPEIELFRASRKVDGDPFPRGRRVLRKDKIENVLAVM